jgi:membrane protein involved in colicin uptake
MDMSQSSSVIFSLRELERMEEERVRSQAQAEALEREARDRALREAQERVRVETEARERVDAEARREVERRSREEAARIEAIHRASVEAARATAEAQARADEQERRRRHELELERTRALSQGRGLRGVVAAALFGAVVSAGIAVAVQLGVVAPRDRARAVEATAAIASRDSTIEQLRSSAAAADARIRSLADDLAAARGDNDRLRAGVELSRRPSPTAGSGRAPVGVAPRPDTPRLNGFTSCPPGSQDPLCLH